MSYTPKSFENENLSANDSDLLLMLSDLYDLREYKKCAYFAQNRLKEQEKQGTV